MIKTKFIFEIKLLYQNNYIFNDIEALNIIRFDDKKIIETKYIIEDIT